MTTITRTPWGDQMEWDVGPVPAQTPPPGPAWTGKPVRPAPRPTATNQWPALFPTATRCHADVLIDGEEYYRALIAAIRSTTGRGHYIYMTGWELDDDFPLTAGSRETFRNVLQGVPGGVEIRILIWDNLTPKDLIRHRMIVPELNKLANTRIFLDNPTFLPPVSRAAATDISTLIAHVRGTAPSPQFEARLTSALSHRVVVQHEKLAIVKGRDGLIAFCGGMDVHPNRVFSDVDGAQVRFPFLHDAAVRVSGPAAHDILKRFRRRWAEHPQARTIALDVSDSDAKSMPPEPRSVNTFGLVVGTFNSGVTGQADRSFHDAYFTILQNARNYIHIEDQYMVNLDVAAMLNRKIKEPTFGNLTLVIQDASQTTDIGIPNRKRKEFMDTVLAGTSPDQKAKVLLSVIDTKLWKSEHYHPALHTKALIVDDEIAIIGSGNVTQRSFTCDSETSMVIFNAAPGGAPGGAANFAAQFLVATLRHFLRTTAHDRDRVRYLHDATAWQNLPRLLGGSSGGLSQIISDLGPDQEDLDVRIGLWLGAHPTVLQEVLSILKIPVPLAAVRWWISDRFDRLWKEVIDPKV
jgi:phosphatidylserine/phosphatidylglycerophosphate/cardiolipin synthase-like enzyme